MKQKILQVQGLCKHFGKHGSMTKALNGMTFDVMEGEFLGIMGKSGSGKTTLLNCIATALKPTEGKILLNGEDIGGFDDRRLSEYRGSRIGYLYQDFELLDNLTGRENITLPLAIHGKEEEIESARFRELVDYLEIKEVLDKFPSQMSGGEKQRVAAARALIPDPGIVLADEPTGALDTENARALMQKLNGLNREFGRTILMVTHDAGAASYCSRILFMQDGYIFHELRREFPQESQKNYYKRILAAMAQLGGSADVF